MACRHCKVVRWICGPSSTGTSGCGCCQVKILYPFVIRVVEYLCITESQYSPLGKFLFCLLLSRDDLATVWDELVEVDIFTSTNPENLALFQRPELGVTLTKLHAWKLTHYKRCVFLDADALVRAPVLTNRIQIFHIAEVCCVYSFFSPWPRVT